MPIVTGFPYPYSPSQVSDWPGINTELQDIGRALREPGLEYVGLKQWNAAPAKPFTGMVVLADGVNWNPGAGQGVYCYYGAAWNLLG